MAHSDLPILRSMIARCEKLLEELKSVYKRDLVAKEVSLEALNITHEVVEKCSNILDQAMTAFFDRDIKPKLSEQPKRGGYFPCAIDEQAYRSALGQWKASDLASLAPELDCKLRSLQPFNDASNAIFGRIRELANKKHSHLSPQVRSESKRVNVTREGQGGVAWTSGVTFGSGVSVMGVPIDPRTQMPVHSNGIDVTVERWVSFHFAEGGEDALQFCQSAIDATARAIKTLLN